MKHQKTKKIILWISLIPYLIFLILGFINCIKESIESNSLDLYALVQPIGDFWSDIVIVRVNIFAILLLIFCIGYPIYYLIDMSSQKKNETQDFSKENLKKDKSYIIYLLSFIPYLFLIYFCIFGIEFGFFSSSSTYYGFEAIILTFCIFCIIPIYPIVLIFQTIYTFKKYKTFDKKRKKTVKFIVISIITLLIVPSIIYLVLEKNDLKTTILKDKVIIEEYLINTFGEELYQDMEIMEPDRKTILYRIKSPLVDYAFEVTLNDSRTEIVSDTFIEDFCQKNDLGNKMDYYLTAKFNLPDNMKINSSITNINMEDYNPNDNSEKLLSKCEYVIDSFYIYVDTFNKDEIINLIKDFYLNNHNSLLPYYSRNWISFLVKSNINNDYLAEINIYNIHNISINSDKLHLNFRGYTDGSGRKTIENFEEYVDLDN